MTTLKHLRPVPLELWTRCVPATAADWDKARGSHGPHTQRFIRVYANPYAIDGLARKPPMNPTGATIVKEKLVAEADPFQGTRRSVCCASRATASGVNGSRGDSTRSQGSSWSP